MFVFLSTLSGHPTRMTQYHNVMVLSVHAVVSAVSGLKQVSGAVTDNMIVGISCGVLVLLFAFQCLGTNKVMGGVLLFLSACFLCCPLATMVVNKSSLI